MSSDNIPKMTLHDPSHAVYDYLDRLMDDGALQSEQDLPSEEESAEGSLQADSNKPNAGRRSETAGEPATSAVSSGVDDFPREQLASSEPTESVVEKIEVPVKENVGGLPEEEVDSIGPSLKSISLLKFQVMGINFAVPVERCAGDFPCPEHIALEHEGSKWVLGEIEVEGRRIRIIDVASIVIPDSRRESLSPDNRPRCSRVLGIADTDWGFVCEGSVERIDQPVEEIRWRTQRGKRQWLTGTIVEIKCALLDVNAIERILDS